MGSSPNRNGEEDFWWEAHDCCLQRALPWLPFTSAVDIQLLRQVPSSASLFRNT